MTEDVVCQSCGVNVTEKYKQDTNSHAFRYACKCKITAIFLNDSRKKIRKVTYRLRVRRTLFTFKYLLCSKLCVISKNVMDDYGYNKYIQLGSVTFCPINKPIKDLEKKVGTYLLLD